jgi:hypothetical protein
MAALTRTLMASPLFRALFGSILGGRQAVDDFGTIAGGRRLATSVGGVLTGRGADLIIIDDPQKADDALSESSRKATHTWFDNTLLSRLNDKRDGAIMIVSQRLHQDDLVGHVLEQGNGMFSPWPPSRRWRNLMSSKAHLGAAVGSVLRETCSMHRVKIRSL